MSKRDPKIVIIKDARLAFVSLDKPKTNKLSPDQPPKYEATLLIPKKYNMDGVKRALKVAIAEKFGENAKIKDIPIKDGDEAFDEKTGKVRDGYKGHYYIRATANQDRRPQVIDQMGEVADPTEAYSGCYADVAINAFAWEWQGKKKGVSFGLQAIRLSSKEGKRFGGGPIDAARLFAEEDGDDSYESDSDDSDELDLSSDDDGSDFEMEDETPPARKGKPQATNRNFLD